MLNGWAGVLYRPSFFADGDGDSDGNGGNESNGGKESNGNARKSAASPPASLLATSAPPLASSRFSRNLTRLLGNLSFLDDHYISASLTQRAIPILIVPPLVEVYAQHAHYVYVY